MTSTRINIRMPRTAAEELSVVARAAGYQSTAQLARCVLIQFLRHRKEMRETPEAGWMDAMANECSDHLNPKFRKNINERL